MILDQTQTMPPSPKRSLAGFWSQRFAAQYRAKCGFDAGVEQQVFKLLETADEFDADWTVLEMLDRRARLLTVPIAHPSRERVDSAETGTEFARTD
jgi:hypothetical protein